MLTAEKKDAVSLVRFAVPCSGRAAEYRGKSPAQAWAEVLANARRGERGDLAWLMNTISHYGVPMARCACTLSIEQMASMPLSMVLEALAAARKSSC